MTAQEDLDEAFVEVAQTLKALRGRVATLEGAAANAVNPFTAMVGIPNPGDTSYTPGLTGGGAANVTLNRVTFFPWWSSGRYTADAFRIRQNVAGSGGSGLLMRLGMYKTLDGLPDLSQLIASASYTPTSSSPNAGSFYTFGSPITVTPGMYWLATNYTHSAAPTTLPSLISVNSVPSWSLGSASTQDFFQTVRGLILDNQSTLPVANLPRSSYTYDVGSTIPIIGIRRSAS